MTKLPTTGVLGTRDHYQPFEYPEFYNWYKSQSQMHWVPSEVDLAQDLSDWKKLTNDEQQLLLNLFRFFVTSDIDVSGGYADHFIPLFKKPEVRMALLTVSSFEAIHIDAYSLILENLGLPTTIYKEFHEIAAMLDKHEFLHNFGTESLEDLAKTIAVFSGLTEGVQLFSSFAMLLAFPRHNLMNGMGTIVDWSVRDECVSSDHEVLTPSGWVPFPELKDGDKVAQFDPETREISFVVPDRVVRKEYKGPLHGIDKRHFSIRATPNHDILLEGGKKVKAGEFTPHQRKRVPTSGVLNPDNNSPLTALEKLKIAYAADGHKIIGEYRNGNLVGYQRVTFSFKKERKINRLKQLCEEAGIVCDLLREKDGYSILAVNFPVGHAQKELNSWVDLENINPQWAEDFLNEVVQWDGSTLNNQEVYCTTNKKDAELVQTIAHLGNRSATFIVSEDNRKETYKTYYRVSLHDTTSTPSGVSTGKFTEEYDGVVYCVSVPTGCFLVRHNNRIHATGNSLHVEMMSHLFKTLVKENPEIWTDSLKYEIYSAAERIVDLEDKFIDTCFEHCDGQIRDLTAEDVKGYIRYIADRRLLGLNLKAIFKQKTNPLPWLNYVINSVEHSSFFERRATSYAKGSTTGSWGDIFK